jgi:hypothetical protein
MRSAGVNDRVNERNPEAEAGVPRGQAAEEEAGRGRSGNSSGIGIAAGGDGGSDGKAAESGGQAGRQ